MDGYVRHGLSGIHRRVVTSWLSEICGCLQFNRAVFFRTVALMELMLNKIDTCEENKLQSHAVACLAMAVCTWERCRISMENLVEITDDGATAQDIEESMRLLLNAVQSNPLALPSFWDFLVVHEQNPKELVRMSNAASCLLATRFWADWHDLFEEAKKNIQESSVFNVQAVGDKRLGWNSENNWELHCFIE